MSNSVRSPCVNICALDEQDICVGCYRMADEIFSWTKMTNDERLAVMQKVAVREQTSGNFIPTSK